MTSEMIKKVLEREQERAEIFWASDLGKDYKVALEEALEKSYDPISYIMEKNEVRRNFWRKWQNVGFSPKAPAGVFDLESIPII